MSDHEPFKAGEPFEAPYYKAVRKVRGSISKDAEAKDVMHAFGIDGHARGEALLHLMRAGRKPGESVEKDLAKVLEYVTLELEWIALGKGGGSDIADVVPGCAEKCDRCEWQYPEDASADDDGNRCDAVQEMSVCTEGNWFEPREPVEPAKPDRPTTIIAGYAEVCDGCFRQAKEPFASGIRCGACFSMLQCTYASWYKPKPTEAGPQLDPERVAMSPEIRWRREYGMLEMCKICEHKRNPGAPVACVIEGSCCAADRYMVKKLDPERIEPTEVDPGSNAERVEVEEASQRPPPVDTMRYGTLTMCADCDFKVPGGQPGSCRWPKACGKADRYIMSQRESIVAEAPSNELPPAPEG